MSRCNLHTLPLPAVVAKSRTAVRRLGVCALWLVAGALALSSPTTAVAQSPDPATVALAAEVTPVVAPKPTKKPWYEVLQIRGYTQVRTSQIAVTNEKLVNGQGDKSIGGKNGLLIRRARIILSGEVHPLLSVYLQPDFASAIGDQFNVTILRDWYADVFLNTAKTLRVRVGQSKVPYGFENLQSSSNRLALDRADAINSAVKDERDLGAFVYFAPTVIRKRFKHLVDSGLKGSGDYGVAALGLYNGQTANNPERNRTPHLVARLTWPFDFGGQFVELATGGYIGEYVPKRDKAGGQYALTDARVHATLVVYPQPLGFQAEYTIGVGPELREGTIVQAPLHGGYAQIMFRADNVMPFVKAQLYDGARKQETNAPPYEAKELELGVEWHVHSALELTAIYTLSQRSSPTKPYAAESGQFGRLQLQFNY